MVDKININEKFSKFSEHWRPKAIAELNGQARSACNQSSGLIATQRGWRLRQPSLNSAFLNEGECIVVPKGMRHRPRAEEECHIFLIEPKGVKNSGDAEVDAVYDAPVGEWV